VFKSNAIARWTILFKKPKANTPLEARRNGANALNRVFGRSRSVSDFTYFVERLARFLSNDFASFFSRVLQLQNEDYRDRDHRGDHDYELRADLRRFIARKRPQRPQKPFNAQSAPPPGKTTRAPLLLIWGYAR